LTNLNGSCLTNESAISLADCSGSARTPTQKRRSSLNHITAAVLGV